MYRKQDYSFDWPYLHQAITKTNLMLIRYQEKISTEILIRAGHFLFKNMFSARLCVRLCLLNSHYEFFFTQVHQKHFTQSVSLLAVVLVNSSEF